MNAANAIEVEGLGKRYTLGEHGGGYALVTELINDRLRRMGRAAPKQNEFWALKDVSFAVAEGETLGIIGHNGAGKSTLLKILSRVTPPTVGKARLRGRVGAMLEVGTGFHPELTGRENVFLNGAILGMTRREIEMKFDEIVEFADVAQFLDTPVKRYSSGMMLRLAFSVAAHLEPEILIVDEVLSVGDLAFQRKCLGRMEESARQGRTVLFVSHNLSAVRSLCDRAVVLAKGEIVGQGSPGEVIDRYVHGVEREGGVGLGDRVDRAGSGSLRFTEVRFESGDQIVDAPVSGKDVDVVLRYETETPPPRNVDFAIDISTETDQVLLHLGSEMMGTIFDEVPGAGEARCRIPRLPLPAGQYILGIWAGSRGQPLDWVSSATELTIAEGDFYGTGREPPESHRVVMIDHTWSLDAGREPDSQPASSAV